jgi:hypothetical protein
MSATLTIAFSFAALLAVLLIDTVNVAWRRRTTRERLARRPTEPGTP